MPCLSSVSWNLSGKLLTEDILLHEDSFEKKEAKYWQNVVEFVKKGNIGQSVSHVTKSTSQYVTHCTMWSAVTKPRTHDLQYDISDSYVTKSVFLYFTTKLAMVYILSLSLSLSPSLFMVDLSLRLAFKHIRCKITFYWAVLPVTLILLFE